MAGETSGPGPSEQEIRMVALERKFDELLSFVQLIAKRNTEDENQRKEDDKDTGEAEPEGHSNTNATPPRPPTPPKPEGKDSQLDSKIDSLEEKIRLIQGLNSFGNTDFSSMSWFPNMTVPPKFKAPEFEKYNGRGDPMIHLQMYCRKMAPYADNEPLLIQTFQDTLTGNAAEWYSQLKKISHWKELADTFLAQYGFNSQIAPDRFDLQRMEKKSNETFREYAQRWREKAARARPPLDEREMIKIFVDTLKNPYFDRMMGLQMQFFVDLIPVGDRIEDALKTKKIVDMTALMALAEQAAKKAPTKRKEGDVQMIGRNNGRPRQVLPTFTMQPIQPRPIQAPAPTQAPAPAPAPQMPARPEGNQPNDNRWLRKEPRQFTPLPMPMTELYPILIEKSLISPIVPKPYNGPQRRDFNPNSACDFHFGEVGHTVENCGQLRHRVQDLIDHGVLKFEGLPNITTNPLPKHPEGGVNMVEVEEGNEESIAWRRLFYTLEKRRHITPLDAPPGPSTGDACEYHSGARGHSLDCCEEFKKKVTNLMENGLVGREEIPSERSRQPDDPSEFDWYAEINLDDIVEDEMDLDNLQDEEADWGYFMEDDTDEWRDVDLTEFFQFPYLIVPPGFVTPEFEIFYEDGDPEVHLQKYGEKMALHLENELFDDLGVSREPVENKLPPEYLGLKKDEEPYIIPDPGAGEVIVEIKEEPSVLSLPALTEEEEEEVKPLPPPNLITITSTEEEDAGPMVEGLSIHTIAEEEGNSTTPPARRCQQGEEVKTWTCVPLLQRVSSSNEITRKTSNDPHVSEIDNKTDCSLDNIDNSDEEIELPSDILEALERQDEGSKPNIEELEIVNLANEDEEPREVKIGTRCAAEQKEALIALLREFHEIFAWSYQDMPGLDTDIVVHKIPLKPECKPVKQALRRMKPEVILKIKEEVEKQLKAGFLSTVTYSDWVANIVPGAEEGRKTTNVVFSFMDGFSGYNQIKMAEEDKSKTAFVTHWGTFVYDVMPFGLKNAGATYQRAMVTLFHDMIHHEIEVYVDDMIAKSRTAQDHLTDLRKLFQRLKKYPAPIEPEQTARKPFDKIKEYLLNPPILVPPTPGRPLILYLTVQEASMGCMLGQQDETGKKEQAIYYLSKKFTEPETRYLLVEKTCCALGLGLQEAETVHALLHHLVGIPDGPESSTSFEKPALTGKIARWQVLLSEFDILFVARKAIKGQAIADYLADYPSEQWKLYFDGAANAVGSGIGAVLVSPKGQQTPIAVKLGFDCTNNMTEYEACIVGLQAALEFGAYELEVFGDSLLIVSQTNGEWQARDPKLIPYPTIHQPANPKVQLVEGDDVRPLRIETRDIPAYCVCIEECMNVEAEIDDKPWYYDIKRFIQDREYPPRATENEKKYIRRMAFQFFLSGEILYKRTHDATLLRCVDAEEANRLIQEMHAGLMGAHANGPFLARKIMRAGYYWLTMERDCIRHVQTCHKCQMYQNSKNAPPQYLHTMASPWPFSAWGMDVIGAITPKASNGHEFILVAIDYFTKWVEACSFKNVTQVAVTRFVKNNIICRYGMPEMLITDNASNLNNRMMDQLCQQFKIQHHNSAPYRPKMNGAVEAANKNVKKILSKMTETYKDWHEHLPYALCAYRTSVRTSVGATPYSLVYGMEAVLPVEVEIPSLRILSQTQLEEAEWAQARYEQLNFIDEKRLAALCHGQLYQRRIERAYNKKARPRTFQPGDLVLKKRNMALSDPRGKVRTII
uniref:Integrase catalytic domain-containing protein n=2 Tax=Fagus sylvatica TaxID=28930 RepID=A0A2N9I3P2_FAGSY